MYSLFELYLIWSDMIIVKNIPTVKLLKLGIKKAETSIVQYQQNNNSVKFVQAIMQFYVKFANKFHKLVLLNNYFQSRLFNVFTHSLILLVPWNNAVLSIWNIFDIWDTFWRIDIPSNKNTQYRIKKTWLWIKHITLDALGKGRSALP